MATAPTQYTDVPGPAGALSQAALVYQDANGSYASVTTPWVLNSAGIYVPWPVAADGTPEVELTGSLAPLTAATPVLIMSVAYSSFAASTTLYVVQTGALHRNARARTLSVYNDLNEALSSLSFFPFDSAVPSQALVHSVSAFSPPGAGQVEVDDSHSIPMLGSAVDSISIGMGMGATAASSGKVYVYLTEVF